MKLLLDTQILIWAALGSSRAETARPTIEAPENDLLFSVASLWEIAIKRGLDRPDFQIDPAWLRANALDAGYTELPINADHVLGVAGLPPIHKDPFDRLLIAQARAEGILLLTADETLAKYPGPIRAI